MGHLTSKDAYKNLEDRINWFTQGAPPSETLTKILQVLFTEKEAKWVSRLPIRPFTAEKAAKIWGTTEAKAEKLLDRLCEKGLIVDSFYQGTRRFVLPPPMIGFFEFALMRTRGDIDQKYLSELFYQYLNVEEDFIKALFFGMDTKLGRVFVQEPALLGKDAGGIDSSAGSCSEPNSIDRTAGSGGEAGGLDCTAGSGEKKPGFENSGAAGQKKAAEETEGPGRPSPESVETAPASVLMTEKGNHILDYERATHIIEEADYIGVGTCYCRHKNLHLGIPCQLGAPLETCLTFDNVARSLSEHGGFARHISKEEAKDILEKSYSYNLVQIGENVREHPAFMCNCCGCCCEALQAAKKFSPMQPIETTNFIPKIQQDSCVSCGKCARVCPVLAISMDSAAEDPAAPQGGKKRPVIDESICLGCGICARNCPKKAIMLVRRPRQVITPVNSTHRFVLQAIERGTLQNLIFDNQAFANHRAMAAVFGTILKLPPIKQALASKQFKSIYLDRLLSAQKQ